MEYEFYDTGVEFVDAMIDNVRNEAALFEAMIGTDLYESKARMDGALNESSITALTEAENNGIISTIISAIKSLFKKIAGIFKNLFNKGSSKAEDNSKKLKQIQQNVSKQDDKPSDNEKAEDSHVSWVVNVPDVYLTLASIVKTEVHKIKDDAVFNASRHKKYINMDKQQIIDDMLEGHSIAEFEKQYIDGFPIKYEDTDLNDCSAMTDFVKSDVQFSHAYKDAGKMVDDGISSINKSADAEYLRNANIEGDKVNFGGEAFNISDVQKVQYALNDIANIRFKALSKLIQAYYNEWDKVVHVVFKCEKT